MHIILGDDNLEQIRQKTTVLELDSFCSGQDNSVITAYCVLDSINFQDIMDLQNLTDLHANLMKNFRLKNWNYCRQAIEHLRGHWNGQVDSFYDELDARVRMLENSHLDPDWDGTLTLPMQ